MQTEATIKFKLGAEPTLDDLRAVVEKTRTLDETTRISFDISQGQRDQEYVTLVVQGEQLLER